MINGKRIIALCIPKINDDSSRKFIVALNNSLPFEDCRLMVFATCSELFFGTTTEDGEMCVYDLLDLDYVDVVVICVEKLKNKELVERLVRKAIDGGKPVITVDGEYEGAISTEFDYEMGFRNVVEHVLDKHNVRRPHIMAGIKDNSFSESRIDVFADVLRSRGIEFDRESMVSYGDFWSFPATEATKRLIAENRVPEAIICANDTMAVAVVNELITSGYKIPEDVIVTGFDGIDEIMMSNPKITSCMCSYDKAAERIAGIIGRCLGGEHIEGVVKIPPTMILSESCGCCGIKPVDAMRDYLDLSSRFFRYQNEEYNMYSLVAKAISCKSMEELSNIIRDSRFYDVDCALTPECFDERINPICTVDRGDAYGDKMIHFFCSDNTRYTDYTSFPRKDIFPHMNSILETTHPLLFFGLNYLNVPLGYVCFHFHSDDVANYSKVPQSVRALNNAIGGHRNIRYHNYLQNRVEEIYKLDNLTGLYNRNGFTKEFQRVINRAKENGNVISAALVDLDGLKIINDTYGHDEGDNAIRTAAEAFRLSAPKDAVCVRFGGDEMMAVYEGHLDETALRNAITSLLDSYNASSGKPYLVSASVGVYICGDPDGIEFDDLVKESDKLMYFEKRKKKTSRIHEKHTT
ncbi:MAG: GGDEF domain-containing protein [Ruminococcaceae bacterium]|nr:GGDEF domain-containing protein [Oscillospiraceae bacterium]